MLQPTDDHTSSVGFFVTVERAVDGPSDDTIAQRLGDALAWVEGIGNVEVECVGTMEDDD